LNLTAARSVKLLADLKHTTAEFVKQEDALLREFRSKRAAIDRRGQEHKEALEAQIAARVGEITADYEASEAYVRDKYEGRRMRVERTAQTLQRTLLKRAKDARTSFLGGLQMRQHRMQLKLAADQKAAAEKHGALNEHKSRLAALDRKVATVLSGFGGLRRLTRRPPPPAPVLEPEEAARQVQGHLISAEQKLDALRDMGLVRFFHNAPLWAQVIAAIIVGGILGSVVGVLPLGFKIGGGIAGALILVALIMYGIAEAKAKVLAKPLAAEIRAARGILGAGIEESSASLAQEQQRMKEAYEAAVQEIEEQKSQADAVEVNFRERAKEKLRVQPPRLLDKISATREAKLWGIQQNRDVRMAGIHQEGTGGRSHLDEESIAELAAIDADERRRWQELEAQWKAAITPLYDEAAALNTTQAAQFPGWSRDMVEDWSPPAEFEPATRFGQLDLDLAKDPHPRDPRLALPGSAHVSLPLMLAWPEQGSLLVETEATADSSVVGTLQNVMLRLFASSPPGKLAMTIIDPVGLGQNFAGLMHLADYEESLINRRIWTQRDQIDDRLSDLNEHIEKVIQMYLRNEYATIMEYNERAGSVAEKYHFLVVADFPEGFSDAAARRLQSIAVSGPRCGVFTLIHWNKRQSLPDGFTPDDLRRTSVRLRKPMDKLVLEGDHSGAALTLDQPPSADLAATLVHKMGKASIDSNRVEVPFAQVAPAPHERWANETTNEVRVAIGRTGATKQQMLAIGKGTKQHALFAGKTGSGKSTLFHVIITNLALSCTPDQVEFYLIDFKKGVEFKCYATKRLPHARVVAIESDREFGLSVLQRVDEELKRRGDIFRKLGVQDIPGYKRSGATEPMPRTLLIIDEFQEFYTEDDQIAQTASLLFDRIVRQGRAFGIHVLLGSQTLGGAYTLARATLGQMVIRVALQCNEADAYLIMDENNAAPRLLTRPGEGIYNDASGAIEGNSPFQVVWLGDDERDEQLDIVRQLADERHDKHAAPIVFEGNAPAEVRENTALSRLLEAKPSTIPMGPRIWLGAPNSIKGPTEAAFHRQSGNHLMVVGQREEAAITMIGLALIALSAQHPKDGAQFVVFHASTPGSADEAFLNAVAAVIPQGVRLVTGTDVSAAMNDLATELGTRTADSVTSETPNVFVFIHGLQRFKKLRSEDDFSFSTGDSDGGASAASQLNALISDGSSHAMHLVVTLDTFNNVGRFLTRKALTEFEMRVVFQMSANDSASLIDSPKASTLGLHRALLYNEQAGTLETFRPYALPDEGWIGEVGKKLG
jgi:S-DNA-T family DNA segregation ATPase FtsK/SpoIIIE